MYKLLWIMLMSVVWMVMHALQTDEEMAMHALYQGKHAVNRAAHAAAQQLDPAQLAEGHLYIEEEAAAEAAVHYLQQNMELDENGDPLPGSYFQEGVELLAVDVINDGVSFPYLYRNNLYDYEVTLDKPGVVVIIGLKYPRVFSVLPPIEWTIKGTAELVGG
ncbi:hypothetical protein FHS18_004239 [Paenibacillus phyllosphaerae]|uniref:Uncharacterized protein n=1 Tax=Paenibacillus phyllosphaerae TaxID=274593 RepID=A0A7W5B1X3_9BACL|nr:hypothetical protein [Paenibacillus phyllosphaerae]MBB3112161.1 hypothetical protein [Paenibacillus phyllosphaerae]